MNQQALEPGAGGAIGRNLHGRAGLLMENTAKHGQVVSFIKRN